MIAEQEQTERRAVVQSALASQRIKGLEPDAQAVADAERWARVAKERNFKVTS